VLCAVTKLNSVHVYDSMTRLRQDRNSRRTHTHNRQQWHTAAYCPRT